MLAKLIAINLQCVVGLIFVKNKIKIELYELKVFAAKRLKLY